MKQLETALMEVGFESPRDELDRITREIAEAHPTDWDVAFELLCLAIRDKAHLLWEMLRRDLRRFCDDQRRRVMETIRAERETARAESGKNVGGGGDLRSCAPQESDVKPVTDTPSPPRAVSGRETGLILRPRGAVSPAAPIPTESPASPVSGRETPRAVTPPQGLSSAALIPRRDQGSAIVAAIARKTVLDTMIINGLPLRRSLVVEARRWGERRERDGRVIRLLLHGVPDTGEVGQYVNDAMADEALKLAEDASNV